MRHLPRVFGQWLSALLLISLLPVAFSTPARADGRGEAREKGLSAVMRSENFSFEIDRGEEERPLDLDHLAAIRAHQNRLVLVFAHAAKEGKQELSEVTVPFLPASHVKQVGDTFAVSYRSGAEEQANYAADLLIPPRHLFGNVMDNTRPEQPRWTEHTDYMYSDDQSQLALFADMPRNLGAIVRVKSLPRGFGWRTLRRERGHVLFITEDGGLETPIPERDNQLLINLGDGNITHHDLVPGQLEAIVAALSKEGEAPKDLMEIVSRIVEAPANAEPDREPEDAGVSKKEKRGE
jgi:hypothetical protein